MTYLIFVRHGERSDAVYGNEESTVYTNKVRHDPTLTAEGMEQATLAGTYIDERIKLA